MEIKFLSRITLVLGTLCCLSACREQGKVAGGGDKVAIPENFEIDFDGLFDLKQPCVMTPPLLESKVAAIAIIPREKLCKPVKFPQETCHYHWFSAKDAPVHNPGFSIFKSEIHPNFVSVVWQEQAMERFYCVYPAEKDQEVPTELLADIDASLSVPHVFNTVLKQFEWELEHFSVSAKYSTSVGKGDPSFLVNVRNKEVKPMAKTSVKPTQMAPRSLFVVDLDELIDWRAPASLSMKAFDAKIDALETAAGQKLFRRTSKTEEVRFFDPEKNGREVHYVFFNREYHLSGGYVSWKMDGTMNLIDLVHIRTPDGNEVEPQSTISKLDKIFGSTHIVEQQHFWDWNTAAYTATFLKYSNSTGHGLRFSQPRNIRSPTQLTQAATTGSPVSVIPTPVANAAPTTTSSSTPAAAPVSAAPASNQFKLRLTQMNGLLISQLSSGQEAGQVTKMTLTALPNRGDKESWLEFNQEVGGSMRRCLNEVSKLSQLRHDIWPPGYSLQIGFEDKYIDKDGPSAAVACALLVESAITGRTWDPAFAVTGDLNADGSVQPIGGVRAKIRGATNRSCKLVAVPAKNERSIADILLLDGPAPLVGITVFGIKTFDDAMLLANPERPQALKNALADFEAMRAVMMRDPKQIMPLLRTPHAVARLQALLAAAPACYSAKYLLLHAQGRTARVLSLGGSIEAAQNSAQAIVSSIDNDVDTAMTRLKPDEVGTSLNKLRNLRPLLDQRIWPYVDGITDYGEVIRSAIVNPVRSGARYNDLVSKANQAAGSASAAFRLLMNSAQVREELGL